MDDNTFTTVIAAIIVFVIATVFGGFIIWLIWPVVVYNVFPGLVQNGTIAGKIGLWPAICLSWFCSLLIKSSNTNNKKD